MSKSLKDKTQEEIAILAQKNVEEWNMILIKIEKASKAIGITVEEGFKFIDILMFGSEVY